MYSPYVMFIVVLTVVMVLTPGSNASCSDIHPDINLTTVATMCTDSVVTGRNVYIDTSQASNMLLTSGSICTCQAELTEGTFNVSANFTGHTDSIGCGSYLHFQNEVFDRNVSCETSVDSVFQNITNITVGYHTVSESATGDFCVHLQQNICDGNKFQCTDGTCVPEDVRCNAYPDCTDGSDEQNCGGTTCTEGLIPCDYGTSCFLEEHKCDGKDDCPDGSDESLKYCGNETETNDTSSTPEKAFITVMCQKVQQISTTTPVASTPPTTSSVATQPPTTSPASTATPLGTSSETPSTAPPPSVTTTPYTESTQTATDPPDTSSDNISLIVGIVVACIVVLLIAGIMSVIIKRRGYCANIKKYAVEKMRMKYLGDNKPGSMTNID